MVLDEDTEEGGVLLEATPGEKHECQRSEKQYASDSKRPVHESGPEPSPVSQKSNESKECPLHFKQFPGERSDHRPDPSSVSIRSDESKKSPLHFGPSPDKRPKPEPESSSVSIRSDESKKTPLHFEQSPDERFDQENWEAESGQQHQRQLTFMCYIGKLNQQWLGDCVRRVQPKLKSELKKRFQCMFEGFTKAGNPTLLNQIYTELYIIEGDIDEVNIKHEVRQIESASRKTERPEAIIKQEDIFTKPPGSDKPSRTVMTKGVAGIGKTVLTQKFCLDWVEGTNNQDFQFVFPFTFRELNVLKEKKFSLLELVQHFFPETKEVRICSFEHFQVVFIFDGLDECRLPLDFKNTEILTDVTKPSSVDVLLTNLIRGNLLPTAHLWITTRPAAAGQIPRETIDMVTEIKGFTDSQKEEYFSKKFYEEEQAKRIISHIKSSRSLHIMCHIPIFCWIAAMVLEEELKSRARGELPKTLTDMYIHFLVVQSKVQMIKYNKGTETNTHWNPESKEMIECLGKLAFEQLQKGNLIFYESDLKDCGIDISVATVCSGVFTQIFKEERGMCHGKMFCFVHLSVQEFLAALHVHLTFINSGVNLLEEQQTTSKLRNLFRKPSLNSLHASAINKALQSPNGHLDLLLRFLLGLSVQTNQTLLQGLLSRSRNAKQSNEETVQYIKKKINENLSAEKSINLFHCLNEMDDHSLVDDIQNSLRSGSLSTDKLSPGQWSAVVFILLSSEENLDVFDLKKYSASDEALLRLLPVVKASNKALLNFGPLSERSLNALASVLISRSSALRELDLNNNHLQESGMKVLLDGLKSPHCILKSLRLAGCVLSDKSLDDLSSVLSSHSSPLRVLDLSNNDLQDSGVQRLLAGMQCSSCQLENLRLSMCNISWRSCETLSSVLGSESSSLIELDLSNNDLQDSGVKILSAGLQSLSCRLEALRVSGCLITEEGCACLASVLSISHTHLRELDLSYNHVGDSGVELLSTRLKDPLCRLVTLRVEPAGAKWLQPGLRKYFDEVTVDTNTANRKIHLSDNNKKVAYVEEEQPYPDGPERFVECHQLLSTEGLSGRHYWEVEWEGGAHISVSYRRIRRRGNRDDSWFGGNDHSWSLFTDGGFTVWHNKRGASIPASASSSNRVAVYVDFPAGILSFYKVCSDTLVHLHTFSTTFTEPLYPGFGLWSWSVLSGGSSVRLCSV
ncbi:NACHT, LRR and PYD domains-containing protein 3-like isoform 2-T2 [Pholidichthys leucotaenia]